MFVKNHPFFPPAPKSLKNARVGRVRGHVLHLQAAAEAGEALAPIAEDAGEAAQAAGEAAGQNARIFTTQTSVSQICE